MEKWFNRYRKRVVWVAVPAIALGLLVSASGFLRPEGLATVRFRRQLTQSLAISISNSLSAGERNQVADLMGRQVATNDSIHSMGFRDVNRQLQFATPGFIDQPKPKSATDPFYRASLTDVRREGRHLGNLEVIFRESSTSSNAATWWTPVVLSSLLCSVGLISIFFPRWSQPKGPASQDSSDEGLPPTKPNEEKQMAAEGFLINLSHEIRTPLNVILGFTDLLRRGSYHDQSEQHEHLATIHRSGVQLLGLTDDLLDYSQIESGRLVLNRQKSVLIECLIEAFKPYKIQAQQRGLKFEFAATSSLPKTILTDPSRFRQALANLLSNAVKFTEKGSICIEASTESVNGRQHLVIKVIDTGIGITEAELESVFQPFSQSESSTSRRAGGTGLGLAISRSIAASLGGKLSATSQPGNGSTFVLSIDPGDFDAAELIDADCVYDAISAKEKISPEFVTQLPTKNILVVDDVESNRKLLDLILTRAGASCDFAKHGSQALEKVEQTDFDLILMDMQMPVMDGYTATRILRNRGFQKPIIALTANAVKGDREICLAFGCSGYLPKPIEFEKLMVTLSEAFSEEQVPGESTGLTETPMQPEGDEAPHNRSSTEDQSDGTDPDSNTIPVRQLPLQDSEPGAVLTQMGRSMLRAWKDKKLDRLKRDALQLFDFGERLDLVEFRRLGQKIHQLLAMGNISQIPTQLSNFARHAEVHIRELKNHSRAPETAVASSPANRQEPHTRTKPAVANAAVTNPNASPSIISFGVVDDPKPRECRDLSQPNAKLQQKTTTATGERTHSAEFSLPEVVECSLELDDPEIKEIVMDFVPHLAAKLDEMSSHLESGDFVSLTKAGHWLKGSGGTVGFGDFTNPAASLEKAAASCNATQSEYYLDQVKLLYERIQLPCPN